MLVGLLSGIVTVTLAVLPCHYILIHFKSQHICHPYVPLQYICHVMADIDAEIKPMLNALNRIMREASLALLLHE